MSNDLHDQIMNLPCKRTMSHFATKADLIHYKEGHRDARHAAAELALATPPVASGALPELPPVPLSCHVVRNGLGGIAFYAYAPEEMQAYARAYGQAIAAAAAPNAALVAALEALIEVAEQCDSWESFPGNAIAQARAALAQAGAA